MLSFPRTMRVFHATQPTDMRKGFDGLFSLVENLIQCHGVDAAPSAVLGPNGGIYFECWSALTVSFVTADLMTSDSAARKCGTSIVIFTD